MFLKVGIKDVYYTRYLNSTNIFMSNVLTSDGFTGGGGVQGRLDGVQGGCAIFTIKQNNIMRDIVKYML